MGTGKATNLCKIIEKCSKSAKKMKKCAKKKKPPFDKGGSACRKTSLCETDSPDTGEVALAPEGEQCPEGAEGENLAIARNISDSRTVLSPTACGRSPLTKGAKG